MKTIIDSLRHLKYQFMRLKTKRHILQDVTTIGNNQNFEPEAQVCHEFGSTKDNVIFENNSELFGKIICWGKDAKVHIGKWAKIGYRCTINCVDNIEIGDFTAIADGVTVVDHNYHPINPSDRQYMRTTPHGSIERSPLFAEHKPIKIGKNVMLGHNVRVCKGVTIGDNSIIGANAVVSRNIPANCIAVGIPAKVVKENINKTTTPVFQPSK